MNKYIIFISTNNSEYEYYFNIADIHKKEIYTCILRNIVRKRWKNIESIKALIHSDSESLFSPFTLFEDFFKNFENIEINELWKRLKKYKILVPEEKLLFYYEI